jgi:hypothetical protein
VIGLPFENLAEANVGERVLRRVGFRGALGHLEKLGGGSVPYLDDRLRQRFIDARTALDDLGQRHQSRGTVGRSRPGNERLHLGGGPRRALARQLLGKPVQLHCLTRDAGAPGGFELPRDVIPDERRRNLAQKTK